MPAAPAARPGETHVVCGTDRFSLNTVEALVARLATAEGGDAEEPFAELYHALKRIARARMRDERRDHTLQTTELVHEVYLRLFPETEREYRSIAHLLARAAIAMRDVLVDHARRNGAGKRTPPGRRVFLDELLEAYARNDFRLLDVEDTFDRLREFGELPWEVAHLHCFGGLTLREISDVMGLSEHRVRAAWLQARHWLRGKLS